MILRIAGAYSLRRGKGSLRRRVNRLLVTGLGVLLLLIILTTGTAVLAAVYGLRAVQARAAEPAAAWLMAGMTDQQSGLLVYLNSGRPESLVLYIGGQEATASALVELQTDTAGTAEAGPDARVEAAAVGWESWAEGVRERAAAARVPAIDPPTIDQGQ